MTARFSKLEMVNLADDDTDAEGEGEGEEEGEEEGDYQVQLVLTDSERNRGRIKRLRRRGKRGRSTCFSSWRWVLIALIAFSVSIIISLMVAKLTSEPPQMQKDASTPLKGAVATDSLICSEMSADILRKNGSAVDAAITALLCVGAVHPESSGIGGGGFMMVYHPNGSAAAIDFREVAPATATADMFHSNSSLSTNGGLAVAVPGELQGMELAHHHYGRLNWSDLFQPVIKLCKTGFSMSHHTDVALQRHEVDVLSDPVLRDVFTVNGSLKKEGDLVKRERLAATLELIASHGADTFYTGTLAENVVRKVSDTGGILTLDDLQSYRAILREAINISYTGYTLYTLPPPSGGVDLLFPLNVLSSYDHHDPTSHGNQTLTYHRLVEAFKYMFALRSQLGDTDCEGCNGSAVRGVVDDMISTDYAASIRESISDKETHNLSYYHAHYATPPNDHGTTHVSVLGPDGMAVSVTSSVNTYFGSKVVTEDGIVLNNEMDDFSSPNITNAYGVEPSESNFISPGKRPLSSTCPVIAVKSSGTGGNTEYLITGGSGGTRIPTATAQVVWRVLSLNESLSSAIEAKRLHHQLSPNTVFTEANFSSDVITFLRLKGHNVTTDSGYAVVQGIQVNKGGVVLAHSDTRKQGQSIVLD